MLSLQANQEFSQKLTEFREFTSSSFLELYAMFDEMDAELKNSHKLSLKALELLGN